MSNSFVNSDKFYQEYYGHKVDHLEVVINSLREHESSSHRRKAIFLAGDSSLDNKYWFSDSATALNGYEKCIFPKISKKDVCYWLNYEIVKRAQQSEYFAINCAVETSRIESRNCCSAVGNRSSGLLNQDLFIRDHIEVPRGVLSVANIGLDNDSPSQEGDVLIVSVGGNDIALLPTPCTICNMASLLMTPQTCITQFSQLFPCFSVLSCDDCCCGCATSCCASACACPTGLGYFVHLFKVRIECYINRLVEKTCPSKILVCMIYYPLEKEFDHEEGGSWAEPALAGMGYNSNPAKLQEIVLQIFRLATSQIRVTDKNTGQPVPVIPVPLFEALNGKNGEDYVARVEPSAVGGHKIAQLLLNYAGL